MTVRKRRRHTRDQIIRKLAEGHKQLADGKDLEEVCRHLEVENSRLKKLVANHALDINMLRGVAEGDF